MQTTTSMNDNNKKGTTTDTNGPTNFILYTSTNAPNINIGTRDDNPEEEHTKNAAKSRNNPDTPHKIIPADDNNNLETPQKAPHSPPLTIYKGRPDTTHISTAKGITLITFEQLYLPKLLCA